MSRTYSGSTVDTAPLGLPLTSPFTQSFSVVKDGSMIKQAAPQHRQALTKLQHRLLYETDSDSSFDLTFSSPSSIGSASEYSDIAFGSSRSRTSSQGRRVAGHGSHSSRSESISSVLGSSIAIQRVLMGSSTASAAFNKSNRQSVRDIAAAFEQANDSGSTDSPCKGPGQLGRVDQKPRLASVREARHDGTHQSSTSDRIRAAAASSAQTNEKRTARPVRIHGPIPAKLKITKEPVKGPLSAPPAITTESGWQRRSRGASPVAQTEFVFPPRNTPLMRSSSRVRSLDGLVDRDDDEPLFDIVPSPSRKRDFPQAIRNYPFQPPPISPRVPDRLDSSRSSFATPSMPSPASTQSRNSMESTYSNDSLSGHPFSLQLPNEDLLPSSGASLMDVDDKEVFSSPFLRFIDAQNADEKELEAEVIHATDAPPVDCVVSASERTSTATLQPLLLSASRPSSSCSSSTLTPINAAATMAAATSMRVNQETLFPLPPFTATSAVRTACTSPRSRAVALPRSLARPAAVDLGSESGADPTLAIDELKREAQVLLGSIRELGKQLDESIPATHHLCSSPVKIGSEPMPASSSSSSSFVATDTSYSQTWRLIDAWFWSSLELYAPTTAATTTHLHSF